MNNKEIAEYVDDCEDAEYIADLDVPVEVMNEKGIKHLEVGSQSQDDLLELMNDEPDYITLTNINGVGSKTAKKIYEGTGISSVDELESNLDEVGKVVGSAKVDHISEAINWVDEPRLQLEYAHEVVEAVENILGDYFNKFEAVGSYRRKKDTVGDIDMLGNPKDETLNGGVKEIRDEFKSMCDYVIRAGDKKMTGRFMGTQVDIQLITDESWPAAIQYFTGPMGHNVKMRQVAKSDGMKLNEYGLWERPHEHRVAVESEEELYKILIGEYIEPEER